MRTAKTKLAIAVTALFLATPTLADDAAQDAAIAELQAQVASLTSALTDATSALTAAQEAIDLVTRGVIGENARAGENSIAIGTNSASDGTAATGVGNQTVAVGNSSVAIGDGAIAQGTQSISIGAGSVAAGPESVAIGAGAFAANGAVAIGAGTTAAEAGTVAVGGRRIVGVADGVAPSDVATMGQLGAGLQGARDYTDTNVSALRHDMNDGFNALRGEFKSDLKALDRNLSMGIAQAAALTAITPVAPGETTVNFGVGHYAGQSAGGLTIAHQLNDRWTAHGGAAFKISGSGKGSTLVRAGIGYRF